MVTETTEVNDSMFGGNASAEGGDEGAEGSSTRGINIVLAHRYNTVHIAAKLLYVLHIFVGIKFCIFLLMVRGVDFTWKHP